MEKSVWLQVTAAGLSGWIFSERLQKLVRYISVINNYWEFLYLCRQYLFFVDRLYFFL